MKSHLLLAAGLLAISSSSLAQEAGPAPGPDRSMEGTAETYVARIATIDDEFGLNAVIVYNPDPRDKVMELRNIGPLFGRTVLVKDNIETREWPTTAGSLALAANATGRDAPLIARMRTAGGVVLGKTNLSEWANIRDWHSTSGWSAVGGLTRNPHAMDRNACGSSSGSGAAVAAGLAWAAIGTETDGSITCPASINGIVGFKPTVGMVSRTHVVPISSSQDTAGPMASSVYDAALLLGAIAGNDPADSATVDADRHTTDFTSGLANASLDGKRIGVLRKQVGPREDVRALFEAALDDMRRAGAEIVEIEVDEPEGMSSAELVVLLYELRETMDAYLSTLPVEGQPRSLAELVAFNKAHMQEEMRWFGQALFEQSLETTDEVAYREARELSLRLSGEEGIDRLLREFRVDVLIAPTTGPAWTTDLVLGDHWVGGTGAGSLAAISGYPHLTVPMGAVEGLPVGLSFMGSKWSDHELLKLGAAYERARSSELARPSFENWKPAAESQLHEQ
ncbi:MAG: amidase [Erythrobacter sp.]